MVKAYQIFDVQCAYNENYNSERVCIKLNKILFPYCQIIFFLLDLLNS